MPRVHHVKRARKAVKSAGIKVGDSYYWWKFRYGGKHTSKTPPRQSQLTNSDKLSRAYAASESLEDIDVSAYESLDDLKSELENIASEVNEIAEEYSEGVQNMPEGLQQGSVAEEMEEKAKSLESWSNDIEQALDSIDEEDEDWRDQAASAIEEQAGSCPV